MIWKEKDINKNDHTKIRKSSLSCFYPCPLSLCSISLSVGVFSPGRMSTSHWPTLSHFLPSLLTSLSLFVPLFSWAVVQHSNWSWWISDGACIAASEYQAVKRGELCQRKEMTCGTGRHSWIDQSHHWEGGGLARGRCAAAQEVDVSFEKPKRIKHQRVYRHFHSERNSPHHPWSMSGQVVRWGDYTGFNDTPLYYLTDVYSTSRWQPWNKKFYMEV